VITSLDRKLMRDLWQIRGQAIAISLVIAAGIGTYVMALCALSSLTKSKDTYYEQYRFGHVFASLKRAPESVRERIQQIPGVNKLETRIVIDVTLDVADMSEPAQGRINSLPEFGDPILNKVYLKRGRLVEPGRPGEVLCSESFALAHQFVPGDQITAVINGRYQRLTIVGIVLSPEYIIQIPAGKVLPDDKMYGVLWMCRRELEAAYDMKGAFNNVSLTVMRGASEADVIERVDDLLSPYGGIGANGRNLQVSHQYISDEIRQLSTMAFIAPTIFLSVAAFLLNVVISRMVGMQREQIAALKAFGYAKWQIGFHFLKLVVIITLFGSAVGIAFGAWLGHNLTIMYTKFYKFPIFFFEFDQRAIVSAILLSLSAAILGTIASVARAIALPPAQAMRPEPPARYQRTVVEKLGLGFLFPQTVRMMFRNLERRLVKSMLSCLGIALAVSVLILGSFTLDAVNYIIDFQFRKEQLYDVMITFREPSDASAFQDVCNLPGVIRAEPFRAVPVLFRSKSFSKRAGITGLPKKGDLFQLLDTSLHQVELPDEGVVLSDKLAKLLHVQAGEFVQLEMMEGERKHFRVPVSAIIVEYGGVNAYMNRAALNRLLREEPVMSGAFLDVDEKMLDELYETIKVAPRVAAVTVKATALKSFRDTVAENLLTMRTFNILFATVIAFGVVYNSARIAFSEQSRELATLRVIGFTRAEVSVMMLGELAILTILAIPIGWVIGYGMAAFMVQGMDTENYRVPLVVERGTYVFGATVVILAAIFSGLVVRRQIDHLDLVSVLKTKE
jgi:putative ABC transport system permease protein